MSACPECNIEVKKGNIYCGCSCAAKARNKLPTVNKKGRFNKDIRPPKYKKICCNCNVEFLGHSSQKKCLECCKCEYCNKQMKNGSHRFCSISCSGKYKFKNNPKIKEILALGSHTPGRNEAIGNGHRGKPKLWLRGDKNPNWNGGTYGTKRHKDMGRVEYINWRNSVFKRDNYNCVLCNNRGCKLEAHHIKKWSLYPNLRLEEDNGITLCKSCHKTTFRCEEMYIENFIEIINNKKRI